MPPGRRAEPVSADGRVPPMTPLATHDETRIAAGRAYAEQVGFPKQALEFQMLNGIRTDLQRGTRRRRDTPCTCTSPTARSGIRTSCAGSPNARPTCGSSCPTSFASVRSEPV